nr:hypothetical protein [Ktedonobacteraceae bacterium]
MHLHAPEPTENENVYVPLITILGATFRHSLAKLQIAALHAPDQSCGVAHRVGYTGSGDNDLAMYRLKVRSRNSRSTITLPGFYIIKDSIFVDYERWSKDQETQ